MQTISITGFGSYLPRNMLDNARLPPLDTPVSEEEIERIGVRQRGIADDAEGIAEMGASAARRALERAALDPADIDLVVLASWTERRYIPEVAPKLLHLLGAKKAFGWDTCCACAGFLYGLATAHGFLQNPRFSRALVVASERTSRRARPGSKGTLILGDGAGAFVLERREHGGAGRLIDYELATDGAHHDIMSISEAGWVQTHIAQRELNELASESMFGVASRLLERNRLALDDVAWIVPHSGTAGVQASVARRFGVSPGKILTNFDVVGNISSASIPVALDAFVTEGRVRPGDIVLSMAVGTGWYSAAAIYSI
ncbi:ketoacyl-ACP synthase III [Polyangium aurulentum]|uniref:ketoacyl-ACP synthase III n=1 Tax=Polyangium aurulentum TaxID=2567896 RepID=UPI00146BBB1D|nr:ketoacyl-ACP synthase III [Polyangium aurulentum]UQA61216.1 ketoacyl-ACP synthase III [Polyangium aurulentum]